MPDPGTSQMEVQEDSSVQEYEMQYSSVGVDAEMEVMSVNRLIATQTGPGETLALNTQHSADL